MGYCYWNRLSTQINKQNRSLVITTVNKKKYSDKSKFSGYPFILIFLLIQFFLVSCHASVQDSLFIRINQVGFFPKDIKTGVILSYNDLSELKYFVRDYNSQEIVFQDIIHQKPLRYGKFNFCYEIDFSGLQKVGRYYLELGNQKSFPFSIGDSLYNSVRDSLSLFFKVQRCGPTNPMLHFPCHLSDATKLIGNKDSSAVDLTGGWHDAGDYIKFLKTTAYATYMMIFSYEFDKEKFGYDLNEDGVPDILEEAKVGLDWLLRCNFEKYKLISQVQDERDHQVGFRLPEKDSLQFDRPAFVSIGKNTIGIYSAALALGARIWKEKFYNNEFASRCLNAARNIYSIRNEVPDIDTTYSNVYKEKSFDGKLALAAIELYITTNNNSYLQDAISYGNKADADFWWSFGDYNSLAHYKIAQFKPEFSDYIYKNLIHSKNRIDSLIFKEGLDFSWGTTNSFLGVSLQAILYKRLTGSNEFDSLNTFQRDYILGKNPWGISFIYNIGSNFPKHLHSQIAFFHKGYLPGALSAGPAPIKIIEKYSINRKNFDYDNFNLQDVKYFDDEMDFITNEPTIVGNATALFVFGSLSR